MQYWIDVMSSSDGRSLSLLYITNGHIAIMDVTHVTTTACLTFEALQKTLALIGCLMAKYRSALIHTMVNTLPSTYTPTNTGET